MTRRQWIPGAALALVLFAGLGLRAFAIDNPQAASTVASEPSDSALSERVETLLRTDLGLTGSQFRVQTKGGVVTLAGSVPDEHALRRALDLASGVKGVREVRNSMTVDLPK